MEVLDMVGKFMRNTLPDKIEENILFLTVMANKE